MRRRLVNLFLKATNKLIIRMRAGKRLAKIRTKMKEANVKNREDVKKMVQEDWKLAQNIRMSEDANEDNILNIKFRYNFSESNIVGSQMKLPLEYETNIASFMEKVDAQPPITFDDLVPFDPLECLEFEVHKYQKFQIPNMS